MESLRPLAGGALPGPLVHRRPPDPLRNTLVLAHDLPPDVGDDAHIVAIVPDRRSAAQERQKPAP
jgi:hypothetical protein